MNTRDVCNQPAILPRDVSVGPEADGHTRGDDGQTVGGLPPAFRAPILELQAFVAAPVESPLYVRMTARSTDEPHRTVSSLELLFDLTFVVAVASVTEHFTHTIIEGHALQGVTPFLQVFFAIWLAWMNFTWFGSAYDTDDVLYRLLTLVQMAGVLVLAAGVPAAANFTDFRTVTFGYFIMRLGLVAQWLRVALEDPASRAVALRYVVGITLLEVGWLLRLAFAEAGAVPEFLLLPIFVSLALLELATPLWAERVRPAAWHPQHIVERYGLFAILLLGESVFAASSGVRAALASDGLSASLVTIAGAGLALLFALWWLYFLEPAGEGLARRRDRFILWGYGHYGIFAALSALGAGLEVVVQQHSHHLAAASVGAGYAVAVPVSVFLALLWVVHVPIIRRLALRPVVLLGSAAMILLLPLVSEVVGLSLVVAGITAVCVIVIAATLALRRGQAAMASAAR